MNNKVEQELLRIEELKKTHQKEIERLETLEKNLKNMKIEFGISVDTSKEEIEKRIDKAVRDFIRLSVEHSGVDFGKDKGMLSITVNTQEIADKVYKKKIEELLKENLELKRTYHETFGFTIVKLEDCKERLESSEGIFGKMSNISIEDKKNLEKLIEESEKDLIKEFEMMLKTGKPMGKRATEYLKFKCS